MWNEYKKFYDKKRVLVTGHTGFKGTWLTKMLLMLGANVTGYSLEPLTEPNLYFLSGISGHEDFTHVIGDVRDLKHLKAIFDTFRPEIVFHLAAQPIVRESYKDPVTTYSTNVMGTVHLLECVRMTSGVRSVVNVTTDKVYKNNEWEYGYRENDPLDGFDPYSNSKSCSELVTHSYISSFFADKEVRVSTARAGNVVGGGDFAAYRIIPDAVRTMKEACSLKCKKAAIRVRNPYSTRPYQHVLEPLYAYLMIAMEQYRDISYSGFYNVGPDDCDCVVTGQLVDIFCEKWNEGKPENAEWPLATWGNDSETNAPHEANFLKLDCSKMKHVFGWRPVWHVDKCIEETVRFTKVWISGGDVMGEMEREIEEFFKEKAIYQERRG